MKGLAAPLVAQKLLGTTGEYAMIFLILMAVMSTGSAEVIAVASIVIYDVYQTYICPFKPDLKEGQCILCSKYLRKQEGDEDAVLCDCKSTAKCEGCTNDNIARAKSTSVLKPHYTCETHKDYKEYQSTFLTTRTGASCSAPSSLSHSASSAGLSTSTLPGPITSLVSSYPLQ